jgi:hypothetical protein
VIPEHQILGESWWSFPKFLPHCELDTYGSTASTGNEIMSALVKMHLDHQMPTYFELYFAQTNFKVKRNLNGHVRYSEMTLVLMWIPFEALPALEVRPQFCSVEVTWETSPLFPVFNPNGVSLSFV